MTGGWHILTARRPLRERSAELTGVDYPAPLTTT